jgi:hypothetical protein
MIFLKASKLIDTVRNMERVEYVCQEVILSEINDSLNHLPIHAISVWTCDACLANPVRFSLALTQ